MKAYYVDTTDAEYAEIVFAESRGKAIAGSLAYMETGEWTSCRATRKKHFDHWVTRGDVPKSDLIADGWWIECYGVNERGSYCDVKVDEETPAPYYEYDKVFCCKECFQRFEKKHG